MPDLMDTMEDTGERRRGPLMPSLQLMLMLMPTLGMDITDMDMDTVHTMDTDMEATGDTTGDKSS